ncbi:MAG: hypothetical protein KDJ22_14145 [Candidatus Competibacteraceae bacterium]|nr:hypothetical protein [Candidatus Competibacteraceae bacterium]MCP5452281.1 hypothetical protein [Gammaproteobacteria bacterium]
MRLHTLGGWLLVGWLAFQPAWAGPLTVLFLASGESFLHGMRGWLLRPSETRSASRSITTQTGETLYGFIAASTPRKALTANPSATLAGYCQPDRTDVIVAFDEAAAQAVAQECTVPLLVVRVSRQQVAALRVLPLRDRTSALYLEAEPRLNLQLMRVLLPEARTVGVWVATPTPAWLSPLRAEAQRLQLTLEEMVVSDDLEAVRALRPRLTRLDAVLLPPDLTLINEWSLKPLLLMTVRQGVPVFGGLTARYVEAGVLAAVVADEARGSEQMQRFIDELAQGRTPAPAYPTAVRVVINATMAQTLGVSAEALVRARSLFPRY